MSRKDFVQPVMAGALAAVVGYASTFTLAYFKADGVTAATGAGDLRFVRLLLTQQPAGVQATTTRTLVALRNN